MNKARNYLGSLPKRPDIYSNYIGRSWAARGAVLNSNPKAVKAVYDYQKKCLSGCLTKAA